MLQCAVFFLSWIPPTFSSLQPVLKEKALQDIKAKIAKCESQMSKTGRVSSSNNSDDFKVPIVIDLGSGTSKCGFSGNFPLFGF